MLGEGCPPGSYPHKNHASYMILALYRWDTDRGELARRGVTKPECWSTKCPTQVLLILGPSIVPGYIIQMFLERWAQKHHKVGQQSLFRNRYTTMQLLPLKNTLLHYLLFNQNPTIFLGAGGTGWEGPGHLLGDETLHRQQCGCTGVHVPKEAKPYAWDLCISLHTNYPSIQKENLCVHIYAYLNLYMISINYVM